ncbi:hypothetical protein ABTK24_19555, partial [Acinetobacter baumannii]
SRTHIRSAFRGSACARQSGEQRSSAGTRTRWRARVPRRGTAGSADNGTGQPMGFSHVRTGVRGL